MVEKIINTNEELQSALNRADELIGIDPQNGSKEANELELLAHLIADYESKYFQFELPHPIDAIKYRMEQQGLLQKDLVPFIGSKSKVSEILSGKRTLSLSMIRSLSESLGIPTKVLVQDYEGVPQDSDPKLLITEPLRDELLAKLQTPLFKSSAKELRAIATALYRKSSIIRTNKPLDRDTIIAWTAMVSDRAESEYPDRIFLPNKLGLNFFKELIRLSRQPDGPVLAVAKIRAIGIAVIILPRIKGAHLDGAAILGQRPIIGLSLRHDRLDNFWFTLIHELAHVYLHREKDVDTFVDDIEYSDVEDALEIEANEFTGEMLVPKSAWENSPAKLTPSEFSVISLADKLKIHPAIVAGKIRFEENNFSLLSNLVGNKQVKNLFPEFGYGHI